VVKPESVKTRSRGPKTTEEPPELDAEQLTDTQRRILTAALEVFAEKGFTGASTAEIAARAGVAEKTIFAHYGSKQALLVKTLAPSTFALLEPDAFDGLFRALRSGRTLREVLTAMMRDRIGMAMKHPNRIKLVIQEAMLRSEVRDSMATKFKEVGPILLPTFRDLQARGELRDDVPLKTILRTIATVSFGISMSRVIMGFEPDLDVESEINRVVSLLVEGLAPPKRRSQPRESRVRTRRRSSS
jgi:AcrR family transcriptional regulator